MEGREPMNQQPEQRKPLFRKRRPLKVFYWVLFGMLAGLFFGILAVPNYLTASGERSRVARSASDLRTLGLALETYFPDHNGYPPGRPYQGDVNGSVGITTPIQYLTELPTPPPFGADERRMSVLDYYPVTALILGLVLMAIWILWFRRLPKVPEAELVDGIILWILGIFWWMLSLGPQGPHLLLYPATYILGLGSLLALLWLTATGGVRTIAAREFMVAGIAPALLFVYFALVAGFHYVADIRAYSLNPAASHYQMATDAKNFYILGATGPDGDYDVDLAAILEEARQRNLTLPLDTRLAPYSYDPSNGTTSNGDILRWGL